MHKKPKKTIKIILIDVFGRILSGLITSIPVTLISMAYVKIHYALLIGIFFFIMTVLVLWEKYLKRIWRIFQAGIKTYYFTFTEDEEIWDETTDCFSYLGISAGSIIKDFEYWLNLEKMAARRNKIKFQFLLIDPNGNALKSHICFMHNFNENELNNSNVATVAQELPIEKQAIVANTKKLKEIFSRFNISNYEIRYYDTFVPWWMYLINNETAYVGFYEKGEFENLASVVLVLKRNKKYPNPFSGFQCFWEKLWEKAKTV